MDQFISETSLKWIPYCKFENVEYLNKGGFGTIYKAIWLKNNEKKEIVLKCFDNLNNLDNNLNEFTKKPDSLNYMAIIDYANNGNLRGCLTKIVKSDRKQKLHMLYTIIAGLNEIHQQNLIHCDFHDGNILSHEENKIYISDLVLCRPIQSSLEKDNIYGVVP